jgi:REP element-mobilizing transposase RayT
LECRRSSTQGARRCAATLGWDVQPLRGFDGNHFWLLWGRTVSQSLTQIYLHIVFSTKNRTPFLNDKPFLERIHAYLAGICNNQDCPALIVGGVEDHVHILCRFAKTIEVAELLRELKRDSSKWIKDEQPRLAEFHWQAGYGAFSISPSHVDALTAYIKNQEEHHRKESFQDEFRRLCKKYGIEIDERYAWD